MRRSIGAGLLVSLLAWSAGGAVLAQDEQIGEGIVGYQHVEVPEAGFSIDLPAGWSVDIEMREREDWGLVEADDDDPLVFWKVLYASAGGRPWCDVTWYPLHPMLLEEHALLYEELMTPTQADVERSIDVAPVDLPGGEAYRFVIYNEPTGSWITTYLLEADAGRYFLQCTADERAADDWLDFAESFESLATVSTQTTAEPAQG